MIFVKGEKKQKSGGKAGKKRHEGAARIFP